MATIKPYYGADGKVAGYRATFEDQKRGIPRSRPRFSVEKYGSPRKARAAAEEWLDEARADARRLLGGRRRRRLFGEALAEYLDGPSQAKATHADDLSNARALRWPVKDGRRWLRLEHLPLEPEHPGEEYIVTGLAKWVKDLRGVQRRSRLDKRIYHKRDDGQWYYQPAPGEEARPRVQITEPELLARLEATPGRGPYSNATLRLRQLLVSRVLTLAWSQWDWMEHHLAPKIALVEKAHPREEWFTPDEVRDILIHLPDEHALIALGLAWIGWRWANVRDLTWDRVVFTTYADAKRTEVIQHGYLWTPRGNVKNRKPLVQVMHPHTEQLLTLAWQARKPGCNLVFPNPAGKPFGDIRKAWTTALKRAGIPPARRHTLRHTWATALARSGASSREIAEAGGWETTQVVEQVYAHLNVGDQLRTFQRLGGNNR